LRVEGLVAVAVLLVTASAGLLAVAEDNEVFRPAYALILAPPSGGWIPWPPPGLLSLLATRACPHGFMAVYGINGHPLLAIVYVKANVTGLDVLKALNECKGLVGECYPGTRLIMAVPVTLQAAHVAVVSGPMQAQTAKTPTNTSIRAVVKTATPTITTTTAPTQTYATQAYATATTMKTLKQTATTTVVTTATATTLPSHVTEAGLKHFKTSTRHQASTGWGAAERLAFTLAVSAAATVAVYIAWRMRG
jgi:hypothetical protein